MVYKVGDKVLVKATIVDTCWDSKHPIKVKFVDESAEWFEAECLMPDMTSVETIPQEEVMQSAYNQGLNDAWEFLKKIEPMSDEDYYSCFGKSVYEGVTELSPQEALAKLKAYEEAQEIKVGDVVTDEKHEVEILVTEIDDYERTFNGIKVTPTDELGKLGGVYTGMLMCDFKKTGKHIDIQSILNQIGGE